MVNTVGCGCSATVCKHLQVVKQRKQLFYFAGNRCCFVLHSCTFYYRQPLTVARCCIQMRLCTAVSMDKLQLLRVCFVPCSGFLRSLFGFIRSRYGNGPKRIRRKQPLVTVIASLRSNPPLTENNILLHSITPYIL